VVDGPGLSPSLGTPLAQVALAEPLGLFLGLERELSQKPAGIRTFALVAVLGAAGFYAATALTGLVSSAGAVTSTVALYRTGTVAGSEAVVAVMAATAASVAVKAGLVAGADRRFVRRVLAWTVVLLAVGAVATVVAVQYW
jgi:uncharacterized membrane protein YhiD involved in acid resistance